MRAVNFSYALLLRQHMSHSWVDEFVLHVARAHVHTCVSLLLQVLYEIARNHEAFKKLAVMGEYCFRFATTQEQCSLYA